MRKIKSKINTNLKFVYSDNNTISVVFQNNDLLMGVLGEFNKNLKELEKLTGTNLYFRGNSIIIKSLPIFNNKTLRINYCIYTHSLTISCVKITQKIFV